MKKTSIRVALSFATFPNDQLNSFVILVLACLKTNPLFSTPPVTLVVLAELLDKYQQARPPPSAGRKTPPP